MNDGLIWIGLALFVIGIVGMLVTTMLYMKNNYISGTYNEMVFISSILAEIVGTGLMLACFLTWFIGQNLEPASEMWKRRNYICSEIEYGAIEIAEAYKFNEDLTEKQNTLHNPWIGFTVDPAYDDLDPIEIEVTIESIR